MAIFAPAESLPSPATLLQSQMDQGAVLGHAWAFLFFFNFKSFFPFMKSNIFFLKSNGPEHSIMPSRVCSCEDPLTLGTLSAKNTTTLDSTSYSILLITYSLLKSACSFNLLITYSFCIGTLSAKNTTTLDSTCY